MARTRKDKKGYLAAFGRLERALKREYLRSRNPRHPIYPWGEYCPACRSEIFEEGITLACPSCGWKEIIEDLVTEVEELDAA